MTERQLAPGLHEALLTADLRRRVDRLTDALPEVDDLAWALRADVLSLVLWPHQPGASPPDGMTG